MRIFRTKDVVLPTGDGIGKSGVHGKTFKETLIAITRFATACAYKLVVKEDAEEVGSDMAMEICEQCDNDPRFLGKLKSIAAYLRTMVAHALCRRFLGEQGREELMELYAVMCEDERRDALEGCMNTASRVETRERIRLVADTVDHMPLSQRTAFVLVVYNGMSYSEAAAETGSLEATLRSQVRAGLRDVSMALETGKARRAGKKIKGEPLGVNRLLGSIQ